MEEQLQNTSLNQISKNNEVPNAEITKDLPYIPIEEMFNTPEYDTYIDTMDLAQIQQLNADSQTINKYAAPAMGNMASTRPTLATTTFDPLLQKDAQKFENTATSFARMMNQSSNAIKEKYTQSMQPGTFLPSPIAINIKNSNFDRYYNHPKYAELGFSPYANNEEYYNKNSTAADDRTRMWVQFNNLVGTGFMSGYRSIADLFGGDPGAPDLQSATEMEDATRIGSTSREGTRASFDNLALNSAYTFGVISSIAVEELALFTAAAIQGGLNPASDALLVSRTATNASRFSRAVNAGVNSFTATRALKYTRDMFRQMNNLDNAKDFYIGAAATGTFVGKLFFPETVAAIKNIKTVQNGAQNMSNMAKVSSSFGGFYRDLRSLNYALAESKLESGMVYNQRMTDNIKMQISKNNGGNVTPEQMLLIQDNASKAGFATLQMNAPIIFLSNQLVLGNAFGGFKRSFSNMVNDNLKGISRRIIQTSKVIGPDGKLAKDVFQDVGSGLIGGFNRIKTLGVKGGLKTTAGASLRYFSANFSEGVQEVAQEAISHGVNHYYEALFNNPLAGGIDLQNESLNSAISSQFSEQGFETFMSGFLMGGLVQGPQKIFFQGVPSVYKFGLNQAGIGIGTKSQKEAWAEYKGNREKLINTVLESRNENWNENIDNPGLLTDPHKYNFLIQKEANGQKIKSAYDNDIFGFQDATDLAKFQQMQTMFDTGGTKAYINQLNSYIQLSDEDLLGAFPEEKDNIKNGKLRTRFQDSIDQINKNETIYIRDKNDNPNLNDPSQFKVGSREWQKAVLKYRAFEHMRYLKMFTKDGFNQALKRSSSIYESLASEPMFDKMNTSDITVLLDLDSIDNELYILSQELDILILDKKTNSKAIDKKQGKFDRLEAIRKVLTNPKNLSKDGTYDRKNINALSDVFKNYVKFLANSNDSFVDQNVIDDVLEKMVDYKALKGRAKLYDKTIEAFANPNKLDEVLDRIYALQNDQLNNIEENYKKVIENYLKTHEMNELLNQIANIDGYEIIPDPDQTKLFLETGDARYLTDFYVENVGLITSENNPILYNIIQNLKQTYIGIQNEEALDKEKISEDEINQELKNEISDLLKNTEGIDETLVFSNSKKYNELLVNLYNEYTFKQTAANKEVLTLDEWKNTEQAENFRNAFNKLKQVWIANDKLINEANPLTEEEILDDNKFINWLLSDEGAENDLVDTILSILNVNIADITGQSEAMNPEGNFLNGSTTEKIIKKALSYSIIQVPIREVDGTDSFRYKIYDNKTKKEIDFDILKEFTDGDNLFSSFNDADKILVQLEETFGDKKSFQFEGITLKYGMIVYDKTTGVKYQILSKSKEINNGADLTLLPSDKLELSNEDRVKFFEYVPEGSFKLGYILQDVDTALRKLGPNVSRLNVSEPVTPYGYQNKGETKSESVIRYNTILSVLTEDEIKNLEFIVSLDPLGGQNKKLYSYIDQEPNPYIEQMRSKYRIGIKTSNLNTQNKINTELEKRGIALSADQDNVFAFINVNGFLFKDANGKELNPLNFTEEQINDIFRTPDYLKGVESSAQLLKTAQENFASNRTLTKALDESMKDVADGEKISIPISTLSKGISLVMKPGSTVYDDSARGLNDLDYSTVDNEGNYLIYKLYTLNGKTTITPITNLIGDERIALLEKVEKGLTDQKLFNDTDGGELQNGKIDPTTGKIINDALKAVVLLPNGKYTLVNLKAAVLPQSERDLIFLDFITKAQDVIANKKEIFGGQKDDSTNIDEKAKATIALREFNKTQAGKFYISITRGYNISMQVTPWGKIQLELIKDKKSIFKADLDTKTILSTDENLSINNKIQKLLNKFNEKVGEKKLEINELTNNNFRKSFDKDAQIEVLLAKTQTNVKKEVSSPGTVTLFTDSSINQAEVNMNATTAKTVTLTESFTDAEGTPIPKGPKMTTSTTQFESTVKADIEKRRQEVRDLFKVNPILALHIIQKEKQIGSYDDYGRPNGEIQDIVAVLKVSVSKAQELQQDYLKAGKPEGWVFGDKYDYTKYDAELKVLEESTTSNQSEIEGQVGNSNYSVTEGLIFYNNPDGTMIPVPNFKKENILKVIKADIERRRQEALKNSQIITNPKKSDILFTDNGIEVSAKIITNGTIQGVVDASFGETVLYNSLYKTNPKEINAKYDAELTALEGGIGVVNLGQPVSEIKVTKSPLANVLEKIDILREKLQEGLKGKAKVQALTENKEYNALLEERDRLTGAANKILVAMTSEDIEDINVFVTWANANLPESITIQDIALLGNNLKAGGIRIGAFVLDLNAIAKGETIKGTIYTGAKSLFRYHEAFHSVFRMLLSDAEITKYLSIARKEVRAKLRAEGKNFNTELELFRRSADTYTNMSDARLKQEYYEEYLADKFDAFKVNPKNTKTSSEIKSLFARILDWIKAVFSSYNTGELQTLFENIDSGKYVNANTVANQFTSQVGITLEANALIPYENIIKSTEVKDEAGNVVKDSDNKIKTTERIGFLYLDSAIADPMIASMAAMYLQRVSENTDPLILRSELLDDIIQDFEILYDPTEDNNLDKSEEQKVLLNQTWLAITGYKSTIKKQVYAYLNIIDSQVAEEEYNEEFFEMTVGLRGIDQWDTDASMIGSVNSTPKAIRAYIATTTIAETDFFGNMFLTEKINENGEIVKERLIIPVNFNAVYNGLLKSVKNIEDPKAMLQNMYFFGLQNPETGAVVSRLLTDIGISQDLLLSNDSLPIQLKNASLFQSFTKAFENFRVDYLFTQRDPITGNVLWYSAAERDDINSQMVAWSQAWTLASKKLKSNKTRKNALLKTLDKFEAALITDKVSGAEEAVKDSKLINDSKEYAENIFEYTGIKLSTQFIQFSLSKNKNENETTFYQKALLNANKQEAGISADDIGYMRQLIQLNEDIFSEDQKGINSRIKNLAIRNAPFDETIGGSVFKNAEGNFVYAHQKPTNHLKQIQKLNDVAYLELLKEQKPYLKNNHLLNNEAFMQMSNENRQKILRIAGASVGKINDTEGDINDNISGVSSKSDYGNFTPQEFALSLINSYAALVNTKSGTVNSVEYYDEVQEKDITVALAPVLIRVIEAANTGDLTSLPVVETVKFLKGNSGESILTDEVLDIFTTSIKTEFDRIRRENNEDTKTEREIIGYNVDAYNKEKNKVTRGRAYELHNSTLLLDPIIKEDLEKIANRDDASFEEALSELGLTPAQFKKQLNDILDSQFNEFVKELDSLNIDSDISNSVKVGLTGSKEFIQSNRLLNLSTDKTYNLKQIFFNDWINTKAINEILLGDQAVTLKNGVDAIKRAKAENAATISAYSAIADPEKGVMHPVDKVSAYVLEEPIGVSSLTGKNIDKADAILYYTLKGLRYTEFGFGTLTPMQADLIDRLENDGQRFVDDLKYQDPEQFKTRKKITEEEIFGENGFVANGAMLNSRKLVYADGTTFIKMSAFPLIPQLTSNNIETDPTKPPIWVAKENRKALHNLRIKLEKQEAKSDVIAIAAPLTAYKMLKQDVTSLSELGNENDFTEMSTELSAKSLGLQVANPSNKMEVIDPTQIKNIVTSEQNDSEFVKALDMTVGQIRTAYNLATSRRVVLKFKNKRNLTFSFDSAMDELEISKKKGEITPNLMAFLKFAQSGLKASQSSSQLLEFFSTKDGEQQYNLNNPITINKFESLFLSYLSKGTLAEKLPGHALALVSDFGVNVYRRVYEFDENGIPLRSEIIRQNVWERKQGENSYTNNTIVESNQSEGEPSWKGIKVPKEGVVIMDRLRTNVREFNSNGEETGQRYTETLMPAHFAEIMTYIENTNQPMPEVIAKMFAIRIPSQDNHSTINSKIVDFLPAVYGSVAMFAQELVEISGADFDIDKVYSQIKEWYVKDKKFYEYGSATTDKEAYSDYLTYIQSKVDKKGSVYNEALMLFKEDNQLIKEDNPAALTFADSMTDEEYKKWANTIIALEMLSLPISLEQYITYKKKNGEPYEAPLNNRLLDLKYALMGNNAVTNEINGNPPISYTPASIDILQNLWDEFSDNTEGSTTRSNYMVERSREDNIDIDNTLGKIKAWKANKGAAIGAIVSPNVNLSLLTEYKIELKSNGPLIIINGVEYNTFAHLREQLSKTVEGERKQDIISTLITMATDNAKERLVAKLGLNREALSLVGNLTALGMPIKTSILLINNPKIQNIYDQALNKKEKMDPGVESLIKKAITELYEKLEGDEESTSFDVTDELLRKALDNEITDAEQLSIFIQFSEALKVKNFTSNMKAISDLTNGLGKDISTVNDKKEKINKLFAEDAIMDLSPIYKSDTWQSTYLKIFNQIYDDLLPVTFLTASPQFIDIMDSVLESIDVNKQEFTSETQSKIARDLLSYVTIKAYQHNGGNGTTGSVANLNNNFIYPSDQNSVVDLIEKLRKTEVGKNNFFLDVFAVTNKASETNNNTGLNLVESNTFRSLNGQQKVDLQTSFAKLYGTLETKDDALSIVNYMMVKDGLQITYGTLLDAVSPFVMRDYLDHIETANEALRDASNEKMKSVFGLTMREMKAEFITGYLSSNRSNALLLTFEINSIEQKSLPQGVIIYDGVLTISYEKNLNAKDKLFVRIKSVGTDMGGNEYTTYKTYMRNDLSESVFKEVSTQSSSSVEGFDKELAQKIQDKLEKLYPEIKLNITNNPIWEQGDNVFNQKEFENQVNFRLKVVDILSSDKAKQVFEKGQKANWDLNKILTELQIPKEQKQLILDKGFRVLTNNDARVAGTTEQTLREDIVTDLLSSYSYTVDINTAKTINSYSKYEESSEDENFTYNNVQYYMGASPIEELYFKGDKEISKKEYFDTFKKAKESNQGTPTKYYSNLTVPGGTNYTEQEIATPAITPSIKGHAQFSTENGIGWFRSDEQTSKLKEKLEEIYKFRSYSNEEVNQWTNLDKTKTRRVLEVQSDLFQKGRDKKDLITKEPEHNYTAFPTKLFKNNKVGDIVQYKGAYYKLTEKYLNEIDVFNFNNQGDEDLEMFKIERVGAPIDSKNQFLQLLNKDNNWVTFFVKSIIQDSAKKGYEKVLFPSGNTASKVEGHTTLEEFKKQKEDRIELLENRLKELDSDEFFDKTYFIYEKGIYKKKSIYDNPLSSGRAFIKDVNSKEEAKEIAYKSVKEESKDEIIQLKQELERVEGPEGFGALKPIYNFYENTVTNILNKQFGKENVKVITDEYGNTWNEININQARDLANVLLQKNEAGKIIGQANIKAMSVLVDAINQKQDTLPHEYAHHYIAMFRDSAIVQEGIKKWGSEEALVQSIGEQAVLQKGEAWTWWNKFVKWMLDKFNSLSKLEKQELTQILTDAFLTRQNLSTQLSTSVNPLVEAGVKATDMYGNAAKDIQMADESTQFIGFGTIMKEGNVSSTDKYAKAWGNKANTGVYSSGDTIMVSGSGNFGRGGVDKTVEAQAIRKTLTEKYKPLLDKAIAAGASFRIGNQYSKGNLSDQLIADYLQKKGYTEEKLNGYSKWTSSTKVIQSSTSVESNLPGPDTKINIYASTGENSELSNFAIRPFEIKGYKFNSVEQAFQEAKYEFTKRTAEDSQIRTNIQNASSSAAIKKLGSKYFTLDTKAWDSKSSEIMKRIIKLSFEQNAEALQKLLATGNATLTHTQDKTKWGTEFPKLLMEVRNELRTTQPSTSVKQPIQLISEIGFYKGISITDTENITTAEGTKGAASYSSKNNSIKINRALLKKKYAAKVWTNMRELIETLHGEEVKSKAENLPANSFNTYEEFEMFVIEHEYQHSLYTRKDFNEDFPNGTKGEYETAINNKALNSLSQPIQQSNIGSYIEIGTSGSNQQWAGGFMFGSRPTYKETRDYVKNKPLNIAEDDFQNLSDQFDELNAQLEDELRRSDTTNIVMGTPSEGGTKVIINLEEKAPLIESVPDYIENQEGDILDDALFDAAKLEKELYEDAIEFDSEDLYPQLTIFWDEVIQQDSEKKAKFVANGIGTYDRMIKFFKEESEKGMYPATAEMTSEEVFIEEIKCIL